MKENRYLCKQNMDYDIPQSVSQRGSGEETAENRRIHEIADELHRRCQLYEAQLRDSQSDVNHLDIESKRLSIVTFASKMLTQNC